MTLNLYKVHPNVNKKLIFSFFFHIYLFSELQFKFLARRPSYRRDSQNFFFTSSSVFCIQYNSNKKNNQTVGYRRRSGRHNIELNLLYEEKKKAPGVSYIHDEFHISFFFFWYFICHRRLIRMFYIFVLEDGIPKYKMLTRPKFVR